MFGVEKLPYLHIFLLIFNHVILFHLDMLFWNADKTTVEKPVFIERLLKIVQNSEWIIDGNYSSTMELRIQKCDTVIFLDYPEEVCLAGVRERRGKARSDLPWVEPEEDDAEFIAFVEKFRSESRPQVMALLEKYPQKNILIFSGRAEAAAFLTKIQV